MVAALFQVFDGAQVALAALRGLRDSWGSRGHDDARPAPPHRLAGVATTARWR